MKIFFSYYSPPARAVHMALKALELKAEFVDINILGKKYVTPEFLKANPQHTVPTLVDGDYSVWDSHAIAGYLVDEYGKTDELYPKDPKIRSLINQRLHFDCGVLFPKLYDVLFPLLYRGQVYIPATQGERVRRLYTILENFLSQGKYLAGDKITIADLSCIPSITTLDYVLPVDDKFFPKLKAYLQRCKEIPYYLEANQVGLDLLGQRIFEAVVINNNKAKSGGNAS